MSRGRRPGSPLGEGCLWRDGLRWPAPQKSGGRSAGQFFRKFFHSFLEAQRALFELGKGVCSILFEKYGQSFEIQAIRRRGIVMEDREASNFYGQDTADKRIATESVPLCWALLYLVVVRSGAEAPDLMHQRMLMSNQSVSGLPLLSTEICILSTLPMASFWVAGEPGLTTASISTVSPLLSTTRTFPAPRAMAS